ncbi:MAG: hypothetical protein DMD84_04180 [Candidatus Rokuibacteriota bacterium]|nr:MAG: hypothetical protein DMD84_04180 [Candidatus Rokubacteria bacterium]
MIAYATSRLRHALSVSARGVVSAANAAFCDNAMTAFLEVASPVLRKSSVRPCVKFQYPGTQPNPPPQQAADRTY